MSKNSVEFDTLNETSDPSQLPNGKEIHQNGHCDVELGFFEKDLNELRDEVSKRERVPATPVQKLFAFFVRVARGMVALSGVVIFWVGLWNLYDMYIFPQALWAELLGILLGFLGLFLSSSMDNHAGLTNRNETSDQTNDNEPMAVPTASSDLNDIDHELTVEDLNAIARYYQTHHFTVKERIVLVARAVLALASAILVWKALWNLFDIYIVPTTAGREIVYCVIGAFLLVITGTFISNSGVMMSSKASVQIVTYSRHPLAYF